MKKYKILIKFPTRGRPNKFFNVLKEYYNMAKDKKNLAFLISCDEDDITMNNRKVKTKLTKFKTKANLIYFFGKSKTKVQAINADMDKCTGWDIVLVASDDMIPIVSGYDNIIRKDMSKNFPNLNGVLWYNDGARSDISTLSIMGKTYFDKFNYLYHPDYISLWCDNEFTDVFLQLDSYYKSNKVIIEHQHPAHMKCDFDELYIKNEAYFYHDKRTYEKRKLLNFDIEYFSNKLNNVVLDNCLSKIINSKIDVMSLKQNLRKRITKETNDLPSRVRNSRFKDKIKKEGEKK